MKKEGFLITCNINMFKLIDIRQQKGQSEINYINR